MAEPIGNGAARRPAFAGNPLIPGRQDKATMAKLLPSLETLAAASGDAARCAVPVSGAKVLLWSRSPTGGEGAPRWGLAWQSLADLGISLPSADAPADTPATSAEGGPSLDDLVYLGETSSRRPFFAYHVPPARAADVSGFSAPSAALQLEIAGQGQEGAAQQVEQLGGQEGRQEVPVEEASVAFVDMRTIFMAGNPSDAAQMAELAIAGQARAFAEWHTQYQFCGTCGARTAPAEAGSRRTCTAPGCGAKAYPRVDPVVIMLLVDPARDRVVLGRQRRFPKGMWSCLAGFMEVGESLEESVRREVKEEVGLEVSRIRYHSSQPWPVGFGNMLSQLMVGFYAEVSSFEIVVETNELEDARWFSREEVKQGLTFGAYEEDRRKACARIHSLGRPRGGDSGERESTEGKPDKEDAPPSFFVPGPFAIAHNLLNDWVCQDKAGGVPQSSL